MRLEVTGNLTNSKYPGSQYHHIGKNTGEYAANLLFVRIWLVLIRFIASWQDTLRKGLGLDSSPGMGKVLGRRTSVRI